MRRFASALLFAWLAASLPARAEPQDGGTPEAAAPAAGGAAVAGGEEPTAEAARPPPRLFEGMGRTDEENRLLDELSRTIESYESESRDFRRDIQLLVERKFEEKRNLLAASYDRVLSDLEVRERKARLDAIAQLEEFLRRYPDNARFTPDVKFRLAELYYERSSDEYLTASNQYQALAAKLQAEGKDAEVPQEPQKAFGPTIAQLTDLLSRFPEYRLNDAVSYLLGYCHQEMNEFDKAKAAYEQLIVRFPTSRYATEAWVRIGEYYFDDNTNPDALAKAADAYEHAVQDRGHALYDKALYKLGWVYYRMDRFEDAVARFIALLDQYESKRRGDEPVGGDLREEALQYVAISFADENWGGLQRARETFARVGGRPYEAEIYRRLGNVFFDQTKFDDAITAFRWVLEREPLAKDAPTLQQRIVQAYQRSQRVEESFAEAQELGARYGEGSAWAERWKEDPALISSAGALAESSLYSAASYNHQQAQQYKADGKADEARAAYIKAAQGYGTYMERFPRSKRAYDVQFYLADCLYASQQFSAAADNYEAVRDSTADTSHKSDAELGAVIARARAKDAAVREGTHPDFRVLKSTERDGKPPTPVPLTEMELKLAAATDAFVKAQPRHERAAVFAYKVAELYYAHDDFPEARRRFEEIIQSWPRAEVATFAANLAVESYLVSKDWRGVEETAARMSANRNVIDPSSDLFKDLVRFKLAGRFNLADELLQKGEYDAAARKYLELVDEAPRHEFADKALNNAAICNEKTQRFDSALKLYERIFREYPQSTLAPAALFRVAVNAEQSYDFEKAIVNYQKMARDYPTSKDREAAVYNAARLLESLQRYPEAAAGYVKFVELFPSSPEAPANQFRAVLIFEKQGDWKGYIKALQEFVRKFSGVTKQVELVVDAWRRQGEAWQKLGNDKEAKAAFTSAASEFDRRGLKPETHRNGAKNAAHARFLLAEYEFKEFDKLKIGGRAKALEASFTAKKNSLKKVNAAYDTVIPYKDFEWTLAAFYRTGYALERFAATIMETPVPSEVKRLGDEAVAEYQDMLGQQTAQLEDAAVQKYVATLSEARRIRISNEWTKKTLESLNRFRPVEYPVLKAPKGMLSAEAPFPLGLVTSADGQPPLEPEAQKLGGEEEP